MALCDDLEGRVVGKGGRFKREVIGTYRYIKLWLICIVVQQKTREHFMQRWAP